MRLTLQIHDSRLGWLDAADLTFHGRDDVAVEYDLDYGCRHLGHQGCFALSVRFPVDIAPYRGPMPGFLVDLIPQGNLLRRLLSRHGIHREDDLPAILAAAPLASPGNMRIKEPWIAIENKRPSYSHPGFTKSEIVAAKENFVDYMERHGAPVGGTSGAAGGAPKFLLREDYQGRFHADGFLDDAKTKQAYLIKFPFTDSSNSRLLSRVEKAYHDLLRELPLKAGAAYEIHDDILFIPRFDRIRQADGRLHYHGLESLYSSHGINNHGMLLRHEDNLRLIKQYSSDWQQDVAEYVIRDLLNQALANTDNHGRNTSLIKEGDRVSLSPIYDVTAMKFFKGDFIVPLTTWQLAPADLPTRLAWISRDLEMPLAQLTQPIVTLREHYLLNFEDHLRRHGVPDDVIAWSKEDRDSLLAQLARL